MILPKAVNLFSSFIKGPRASDEAQQTLSEELAQIAGLLEPASPFAYSSFGSSSLLAVPPHILILSNLSPFIIPFRHIFTSISPFAPYKLLPSFNGTKTPEIFCSHSPYQCSYGYHGS
jgi:hypothetical protein